MEKKKLALFSNHGRILIYIAGHPGATMRCIATKAGLSLRAVQGVVDDLANEGYLDKFKEGRRNYYRVNVGKPLRDTTEKRQTVGTILLALGAQDGYDHFNERAEGRGAPVP